MGACGCLGMEIIDEYRGSFQFIRHFLKVWNIAGIVLLSWYKKKKKFEGEFFALYAAWYGLGRAWIEQLRADSLPYGGSFRISQIVAVLSFVAGVCIIVNFRKKTREKANK